MARRSCRYGYSKNLRRCRRKPGPKKGSRSYKRRSTTCKYGSKTYGKRVKSGPRKGMYYCNSKPVGSPTYCRSPVMTSGYSKWGADGAAKMTPVMTSGYSKWGADGAARRSPVMTSGYSKWG
jgi:hypothetical protein